MTSAACFARLAMRSEPAFAGSRKNAAAALNETAAIAINHRGNESDRPRVKGVQAKTGLQHERKQKRNRSDADPEQRPSGHACAKGFDGKKLEVEQRKCCTTSVEAIGRSRVRSSRQRRTPP